jgi:SNF2 family DNA or RNA helicase
MIDLSRSRLIPFQHQIEAIQALVDNPIFANWSEMGTGKTKIVIDAAQILYERGIIDRVLVVAPASVRSVWFDQNFGEIAKHTWEGLPVCVLELHTTPRVWGETDKTKNRLLWLISNYEYVRSKNRFPEVLPLCTKKTLLVLDESSAIKSYKAKQTIACLKLRRACGRIVELNGTPVANNPGDLYSQANVLSPDILGVSNWFHFRARYGIMGGWMSKQIVGWRDIDDLQRRLAPYVIRRLKKDCLDLPEKLDSVVMTVPLSESTWRIYKSMRDDLVAWLSTSDASSAAQTIVKIIRLAQITSGFLGGIETHELGDFDADDLQYLGPPSNPVASPVQEVGREKLDLFLSWLNDQLEIDPNLKILVWARFRPEVQRLFNELGTKYPLIHRGLIWGGQRRDERDEALRLLDPNMTPSGPVVVIGTPASGSMGLNLTAAHTVIYLSNDFSLKTRLQSEDRVHRPGQISPVSYYDVIATGPAGQKTIDHTVIKSLRSKLDLATLTTSAWVQNLMEE